MEYFRIRNSLNESVTGRLPQIKEYIYHCDVLNEPKFIGRIRFEKVDFEPIPVNPVLFSDTKITDLIEDGGPLSSKLLVSGKLKSLLLQRKEVGLQFFQCSVFKKGLEYEDYYVLNMYEICNDYVDISNCEIKTFIKADDYNITFNTTPVLLTFANQAEYESALVKARSNLDTFYIEKLALKDSIKDDFFMLTDVEGGVGYFVSESLKLEIEKAGCTGIEFQPGNLSYNEWMRRDGHREQMYGQK